MASALQRPLSFSIEEAADRKPCPVICDESSKIGAVGVEHTQCFHCAARSGYCKSGFFQDLLKDDLNKRVIPDRKGSAQSVPASAKRIRRTQESLIPHSRPG
jgi:hypothetical protein